MVILKLETQAPRKRKATQHESKRIGSDAHLKIKS